MNYSPEKSHLVGTVLETKSDYKKDIYLPRLEEGDKYIDFICYQLYKHGIVLQNMTSKKWQIGNGENFLGLEIKKDRLFKKTGNFYIEIAEKSDPKNTEYVESGIYRKDNSWLYGIGDETIFLILSKRLLRKLHEKAKIQPVAGVKITLPTGTSKGFVITEELALKYAEKIFYF